MVWGEHGTGKLWSAANVRVYGGVPDDKFLGSLVQFIGQYEPTSYSTTVQSGRGQHSRSPSASTRPENILDVVDLFALPARPRRGVRLRRPTGAAAHTAVAGSPHADTVRVSLAEYAPPEDLPGHELDPDHTDDQRPERRPRNPGQ